MCFPFSAALGASQTPWKTQQNRMKGSEGGVRHFHSGGGRTFHIEIAERA
jgi:hypothetical protein